MNQALLLAVLLAAVVAGGVAAKRFSLPYPIVFVIGGIALPFIPGLPALTLDPNLIFLIVLPPLLFAAGWTTDWFAFRHNLRPIGLLAIGLVIFTTLGIAWISHAMIGLSWPMAFALGAIVAPPDAVAAEAIFERLSVPRRIVTILTGEGLVNDGTALVLYRFAVAAAVAGTFSVRHFALTFVLVAVGGVAVGLACGVAVEWVLRFLRARDLNDSTISTVVILLAPYAAYLPGEVLGVSGVLAVVAAAMYLGRRATVILDSESRIVGGSVWDVVTLLLNAFVFLLIGLQLRTIIASIGQSALSFALGAAVVCAAVILLRIIWVIPATYLPRMLVPRIRKSDPAPSWRSVALIAYSGMRGIVSLAAALALPYTTTSGAPLHGRSQIIVITLAVIFVTLVGQGLTLAPLIRWLGLTEVLDGRRRGTDVRIRALEAGVARLHELERSFSSAVEWETAGRLLREYEERIKHLRGHLDSEADGADQTRRESAVDHRLSKDALRAERAEISRLRNAGEIPDAIYRDIEYDLDLATLRLS
ncbi:MAG TPA: Na+/H+ antiporter [Candidatus Baltobacteraceae bacterium]|nr:Na+/H+ antiporter [Candidatus Baltobacteraceae bacterium]